MVIYSVDTAPMAAYVADYSMRANEFLSQGTPKPANPPAEVRGRQGPKGDLLPAIAGREIEVKV